MRNWSMILMCAFQAFASISLCADHEIYDDDCCEGCPTYTNCNPVSLNLNINLESFMVYSDYSFGKSFGICRNYGSAGLFYAPCICPCRSSPILDASYKYFSDGSSGASAGIGWRFVNSCDTLVGGFHVFYDYREGEVGNYNQVGVSLEIIGDCFEVRANGYFPVGQNVKKGSTIIFDDYDSTGVEPPYEVTAFRREFAMTGLDVEGGLKYCCNGLLAYAGVGGYYFERKPYIDVWGAKGTLRFEFGRLIAIEGQVTWDDVMKTEGRARIEINLPFSIFCNLCQALSCDCKSQARIRREGTVHLRDCCKYRTNY